MGLKRISDRSPVEHEWTGNDDNGNHHHGIVIVTQSPFRMGLRWKTTTKGIPYFIGNFQMDLIQILKEGYARWENEPTNQVRLRIEHNNENGLIRIAKTQGDKGLTIGWLKE